MHETHETHETHTVCVIENDEATRYALRMLLEDTGYTVIEATDGQAGYRLLCESDMRLIVVLDHKMPRMDGCDLLDLVEHDQTLRTQHTFIFVTASPEGLGEDCDETLSELDVPVVAKPFSVEEVLDAVHDAVQRLKSPMPSHE